jgi:hypothetical protein
MQQECQALERLAMELIEAYRRVDGTNPFCPDLETAGESKVTALHNAITEHRVSCPVCQADHHLPTNDIAKNLGSA